MRYDAEHKQKTRARVLQQAANAVRADGPHRVGVADVMRKAGLTHGGFYAHFTSKEEMVRAAIGYMFGEAMELWATQTRGRPDAQGLAAYIDAYLSPMHRDCVSLGCPMAALVADLPRLPLTSREAFASGVRRLSETMAEHLAALGQGDAESTADSVLSELTGALSLARAETNAVRSDRFLSASRQALKRRLGVEQHW